MEVYEVTCRMMTKRERELLHKEEELDRYLNQRLPHRREVQEQELTHMPYRSWCVHCVRGAGRSDAHRRRSRQDEEESDKGDFLHKRGDGRVGWDKTRDTVLVSEDLATGGIRAHLVLGKKETEIRG